MYHDLGRSIGGLHTRGAASCLEFAGAGLNSNEGKLGGPGALSQCGLWGLIFGTWGIQSATGEFRGESRTVRKPIVMSLIDLPLQY